MVMNPNKVIAALRRKNVTQSDLARNVGVTKEAVSKIVNGFRDPSLEVAKRIAVYLGTTIDDLVN